jgi:hypothetical protein
MRELAIEWVGPEISKRVSPTYEWAFMKAYLEDQPNERAFKVFEEMFGEAPKSKTPYWLVRLAIYYGSLMLGYIRSGKKAPSTEERMFAAAKQLDESALRNNKIFWR